MNVRPVWIEITRRDRGDVGGNLWHHAGGRVSYELLSDVRPGELVLHWHSPSREFVGMSRVLSQPRSIRGKRFVDLHRFTAIPEGALTLDLLRKDGPRIGQVRDVVSSSDLPAYFPFQPYGAGGWKLLRPWQSYIASAPVEFVGLLGDIYERHLRGTRSIPSWQSLIPGVDTRDSRSTQ